MPSKRRRPYSSIPSGGCVDPAEARGCPNWPFQYPYNCIACNARAIRVEGNSQRFARDKSPPLITRRVSNVKAAATQRRKKGRSAVNQPAHRRRAAINGRIIPLEKPARVEQSERCMIRTLRNSQYLALFSMWPTSQFKNSELSGHAMISTTHAGASAISQAGNSSAKIVNQGCAGSLQCRKGGDLRINSVCLPP